MFLHHTVNQRSKTDAFGDWEWPEGYRKGDPLPDQPPFNGVPRLWRQRVDRWYGDKPDGTLISHWDELFSNVRRMRSFSAQTEVFNTSLERGYIDVSAPTVGGSGPSAAMQRAARARTSGVIRSQQMSATSRSGTYQSARNASTAVAEAWDAARSSTERVSQQTSRAAIVADGLSFNYNTGLWENSTTQNVPSLQNRNAVPTSTDTPPVTDTPPENPF